MNIPPKSLRSRLRTLSGAPPPGPLPGEAPAEGGARPTLPQRSESRAVGVAGQSLPVLEAFQEFLESERSRSRKRLLTMMTAYTLLLLASIGGAILMGSAFFSRTSRNVARIHDEVSLLKTESASARAQTQAAVAELSSEADRLRANLAGEQTAVGELRSYLREQLTVYSNDVEALRDLVARLGEQTVAIEKRLAAPPPTEEPPAAPLADAGAAEPESPAAEPAAGLAAPVGGGPAPGERFTLSFIPRGGRREVTWHVFIPTE